MALYEFFTSRNNSANAASFVGQAGRLFYDGANGVIKLSDGVTPGGTFIPYNIATTSTIGGIKAGPGANVAVDGTLTIDTTGLPLGIGNVSIVDTTISTVNPNVDLNLVTNGSGNINVQGDFRIFKTSEPINNNFVFEVSNAGYLTIKTPTVAANAAGALNLVGSSDGVYQPVTQSGGMIHVTGNDNAPSRITNDGYGIAGIPTLIYRRARGTASAPNVVISGDVISRQSYAGWTGNIFGHTTGGGLPTSIDVVALEDFTGTTVGTEMRFYNAPVGTSTRMLSGRIDSTGWIGNIYSNVATVTGNLTVSGYTTGRWIRSVRNAGTISSGGTLTIDFSTDALVTCVWGDGMTLAYTNFLAGRVVKVMATKASGTGTDSINLDGVTAAQTSTGTTTLNATADTTTFIEFTCVGTSIGNVFVKL